MSEASLKADGAFALLLGVLRYDAEKRFEVLREEIQHLINGVRFRLPPDHEPTLSAQTSQTAFLNLLLSSTLTLHEECAADIVEIEGYRARVKASRERQKTRDSHFQILWHAKMVHKASVIAERIGDLHDRLEQFLQRTSPDQPDTTLRRRTEQGLVDKYLSEMTRWVHRDLVRFALNLQAPYPYSEIPPTYQFWAYDYTSRHHAFMSSKGHESWIRVVEGGGERRKNDPKSKFISVALSYWMPERLSLHPIIGHELAHQVLRDIYGREVNFSLLEQDGSELGRIYRRLTTCVESWLVARAEGAGIDVKTSSNLVHEVLCDVFAAVRFGYAYAYAWILEMLSEVQLAQLFHDRYGMLRRVDTTISNEATPDDDHPSLEMLRQDVLKNTEFLRYNIPKTYLRGIVLLRFLRRASREQDDAALNLAAGFEGLLTALLEIYTGDDEAHRAFEREFAADLASTVCDEWGFHEEGPLDSRFLQTAKNFWHSDPDNVAKHAVPALDKQAITGGFRAMLSQTLTPSGNSFDWPSVQVFTDVAWRMEWHLQEAAELDGLGETTRNSVRSLYFLGMDDYLYRTGNPARLFSALVPDYRPALSSNSVSNEVVRRIYDVRPIEEFDRQLVESSRVGGQIGPIKVVFGADQLSIPSDDLQWVDTLLLNEERWSRMLGSNASARPQPQYLLELLRIRATDSVLGTPLKLEGAPNGKYAAIASGVLLGRYDAFVIGQQVRSNGELLWKVSSEAKQEKTSYVSRVKKLVLLGRESAVENELRNPVLALILVSLKWDASRTVVARWLLKQGESSSPGVHRFCFLSDGWEDMVVAIAASSDDAKTHLAEATEDCLSLIEVLNKNPFVSNTETLFTTALLSASRDFRVRFVCRVGQEGYGALRQRLQQLHGIPVSVSNIAGNKDFEIMVDDGVDADALVGIHRRLHSSLGDCRLETRVSWKAFGAGR